MLVHTIDQYINRHLVDKLAESWPCYGQVLTDTWPIYWPKVSWVWLSVSLESVEYPLIRRPMQVSVECWSSKGHLVDWYSINIWPILDRFSADTWPTISQYISRVLDKCRLILGLHIDSVSQYIGHWHYLLMVNMIQLCLSPFLCAKPQRQSKVQKKVQCSGKWMYKDKKLPGVVLVWHDLKRLLLGFWSKNKQGQHINHISV